jgi:hypothetical protein
MVLLIIQMHAPHSVCQSNFLERSTTKGIEISTTVPRIGIHHSQFAAQLCSPLSQAGKTNSNAIGSQFCNVISDTLAGRRVSREVDRFPAGSRQRLLGALPNAGIHWSEPLERCGKLPSLIGAGVVEKLWVPLVSGQLASRCWKGPQIEFGPFIVPSISISRRYCGDCLCLPDEWASFLLSSSG